MRSPARGARRAAAGLFLGILATGGAANAATLRVELEPREATVGDRVQATLVLEPAPGELSGEPRFPAWGKTWGEAEIVAAGAPARGEGGSYRQTLTLVAFRAGQVELPAVAVALPGGGELATPAELALQLRSVLPASEIEPEPRPPLPPRMLPWGGGFWWTLASALLLCLAAAAALWRRGRRHAALAGTPGKPEAAPLAELLAGIEAIAARAGRQSLERSHTALSLALRRYFGRALDFHATESTTSEIQRHLRGRTLPGDVAQRANRLLRDCDAVKFARGETTVAELSARLATAREIGEAIDEHLHPAPAPLEATA